VVTLVTQGKEEKQHATGKSKGKHITKTLANALTEGHLSQAHFAFHEDHESMLPRELASIPVAKDMTPTRSVQDEVLEGKTITKAAKRRKRFLTPKQEAFYENMFGEAQKRCGTRNRNTVLYKCNGSFSRHLLTSNDPQAEGSEEAERQRKHDERIANLPIPNRYPQATHKYGASKWKQLLCRAKRTADTLSLDRPGDVEVRSV
jgi:hypothetical protein